jgi:Holliday junction resolvasome RuvABC endonuclease subunit
MIICFDLSLSNTGVAIFDADGRCIKLLSIDTQKEKTHPLKLRKIEKTLRSIKKKYKPSVVVIEESFTRFNKSTHAIYKVRGITELIFYDAEQVCYHATTVRKEVLGRGNLKKEDLRNYIVGHYENITFSDYDQSDAFGLGLCYLKKRGVIK